MSGETASTQSIVPSHAPPVLVASVLLHYPLSPVSACPPTHTQDCSLPHPGYGHVVLGDPSPFLFYPISSTEVRCLVDYPGPKLPSVSSGDLQRYLLDTVAPQVGRQRLCVAQRAQQGRSSRTQGPCLVRCAAGTWHPS